MIENLPIERRNKVVYFPIRFVSQLIGDNELDIGSTRSCSSYCSDNNLDIFTNDLLIFPIHWKQSHWNLVIVDVQNKSISFIDSISRSDSIANSCMTKVAQFLSKEYENKNGTTNLEISTWEKINAPDVPQQKNGYDCGVYLCCFIEKILHSQKLLTISSANMDYYRKRILLSLINKKFLPDLPF